MNIINTGAVEGLPIEEVNWMDPWGLLLEVHDFQARQQAKRGQRIDACRVFLLGEPEVGKTSLSLAMRGIEIPGGLRRTIGIEQSALHEHPGGDTGHRLVPTPLGSDDEPFLIDDRPHNIDLWDFGGQHYMHATHRCYFSEQCLYVLVLDATRAVEGHSLPPGVSQDDPEHRDTVGNRLTYWLKTIAHFGRSREGGEPPAVLIVRNAKQHVDGRVDRLGTRDYAELCESHGLHLLGGEVIDVDVPPGSVGEPLGADAVRQAIRHHLSDEEESPATQALRKMIHRYVHPAFAEIRDQLKTELAASTGRSMQADDYPARSEAWITALRERDPDTEPVKPGDPEQWLELLHRLGDVLYYGHSDIDALQDHIFDVNWANTGVYRVIQQLAMSQRHQFTRGDLRGWLADLGHKAERFILGLLREYELCYPIDAAGDAYLMPSLLPRGEGVQVDLLPPKPSTRPEDASPWQRLYMQAPPIDCGFEPERVLHRLMVRRHKWLRQGRYWRLGAVLNHEAAGCEAALWADPDTGTLRIGLSGKDKQACDVMRVLLSDDLNAMLTPPGVMPNQSRPMAEEADLNDLDSTAHPSESTSDRACSLPDAVLIAKGMGWSSANAGTVSGWCGDRLPKYLRKQFGIQQIKHSKEGSDLQIDVSQFREVVLLKLERDREKEQKQQPNKNPYGWYCEAEGCDWFDDDMEPRPERCPKCRFSEYLRAQPPDQ
ncbi:MAG: COR domain-containing protein [Planctomycetota bacterium]